MICLNKRFVIDFVSIFSIIPDRIYFSISFKMTKNALKLYSLFHLIYA